VRGRSTLQWRSDSRRAVQSWPTPGFRAATKKRWAAYRKGKRCGVASPPRNRGEVVPFCYGPPPKPHTVPVIIKEAPLAFAEWTDVGKFDRSLRLSGSAGFGYWGCGLRASIASRNRLSCFCNEEFETGTIAVRSTGEASAQAGIFRNHGSVANRPRSSG
jgi:hypothetical protein